VQVAVELEALAADGHVGHDAAQRAAHHVVVAAGAAIGLDTDCSHEFLLQSAGSVIWTVCGLRGPDKQPGVVPAGRRAGRWPSGGSGGLAQGLQVMPDTRRRPRVRLLLENHG
jgi:hypothetical protein